MLGYNIKFTILETKTHSKKEGISAALLVKNFKTE